MRNYVQDINHSAFKKTCTDMLSVGVCETVSVHTVTFLEASEDVSPCIILKSGTWRGLRKLLMSRRLRPELDFVI